MQKRFLHSAFTVRPNPAAPLITFNANELTTGSGDSSYVVFPCDADEPAFMSAAKRGYTAPEILDYYLVQTFDTLHEAKREMTAFFNDLTGCAA